MKKANVQKLEYMASGYLHHMYKNYLRLKVDTGVDSHSTNIAWEQYVATCRAFESFGARWVRHFTGMTDEDMNDINCYTHFVTFPDDRVCDKLNVTVWDN